MSLLVTFLTLIQGSFIESKYIEHVSYTELKNLQNDPDYLFATIIYDSSNENMEKLYEVFEEVMEDYHYYLRLIAYDCADDEETCPENVKRQLPQITAYIPNGVDLETRQNLTKKENFVGRADADNLKSFFRQHVPFQGDYLNQRNLESFSGDELAKVILFTNKDKVPLIYRGLTAYYRGQIQFGLTWANQTEVVNHFMVKEFPTLMVINGEEVNIYKEEIEFENLVKFLEPYAAEEKRPHRNWDQFNPDYPEFDIVSLNSDNFELYLTKDKRLTVVHFFTDKEQQNWSKIKEQTAGMVLLGEFDCNSQDNKDFAEKKGVKKFPSIKVFPINRKKKSWDVSTVKKVLEDIQDEVKIDVQTLTEANTANYVSNLYKNSKIGCILLNDKMTPQFQALQSQFKGQLSFAWVKGYNSNIMQMLNLKNYPSIVTLIQTNDEGNLKELEYPDRNFDDYKSQFSFIKFQVLPIFQQRLPEKDVDYEDVLIEKVTRNNFKQFCNKKSQLCLFSIYEGDSDILRNGPANKELKKVRVELEGRSSPIKVGAIDGLCYFEISEKLGITKFPTLVVVNPKSNKFTMFEQKYNMQEILNFLDSAEELIYKQNKRFNVDFEKRDCQEFYSYMASNSADTIYEIVHNQMKYNKVGSDFGTSATQKRKEMRKKTEL